MFLDSRVVGPAGLRSAQEVVPRLGAKAGHPALRVGAIDVYDRPIEHLAGQLDVVPLVPIRKPDARYGLVLCFALERADRTRLAEELVRVAHPEGVIWVVDNTILTLGDEIYATRFVRRRHGRQPQRNPLPLPRVE